MNKIKKMFLLIVMACFGIGTILARSGPASFGEAQTGKTSASLKAGQVIYILDRFGEVTFKGSFSGKKTKQIYEFSISDPSHVCIQTEKYGAGISELDLELFNELTGERIGPCFMSTKAQKQIKVEMDLVPGFYTVKASAPSLTLGSKSFKLNCSAASAAPSELGSGGIQSASRLWFQKGYEGQIASEYEKNFYRFRTGFDEATLVLDWDSSSSNIEYSLLSQEADRYVAMTRRATGNDDGAASGHMQDRIRVSEAGEYCLVFYTGEEGGGSGKYDFRLDQETDQAVTLEGKAILPGESVILFENEEQKKYESLKILWDVREPEICEQKDADSFFGRTQGKTEILGYGKDEKKTYRFVLPVTVEFEDVRPDEEGALPYYYDSVYWAASNHITAGVPDEDGVCRRFDPQKKCSRAQTITFLWRMKGCPEPSGNVSFSDISPESYYYKAVSWAYENGITGGYEDGTFRPREECTRAQFVTFLYRFSGKDGKGEGIRFTDVISTEEFCNAVAWAQENKIVGGYADGEFKGDRPCTRAHVVTFLYRYSRL